MIPMIASFGTQNGPNPFFDRLNESFVIFIFENERRIGQ